MVRLFVRFLVVMVLLFVLVPSCVGFMTRLPGMAGRAASNAAADAATGALADAPGFIRWLACTVAGVGALCTLEEMSRAPDAATQRRLACIEGKVEENGAEGLAAKNACAADVNNPAQWETCMNREFDRVPALNGRLISCSPNDPSQWGPFWAKVIESFACPMGITTWCQTGGDSQQPAQLPPSAYDTACLGKVFNDNLAFMPPDLDCRQYTATVFDDKGSRVVIDDLPRFQDCLIRSLMEGMKDEGARLVQSCRVPTQ